MVTRAIRLPASREVFTAAYDAIARESGVGDFPPEALAEAEETASTPPPGDAQDLTGLPFVTIDPPGAKDLDQAMLLESGRGAAGRGPEGAAYTVSYAIADVGHVVPPGGSLDGEARKRGQTIYLPDRKIPLHPPALSEGAASLLPDKDTAAYVFTIGLDGAGAVIGATLERAVVRSIAQLDYESSQRQIGAGLHESIALLPTIGALLKDQEGLRGGADLPIPDQEVTEDFALRFRPRREIEDHNAQISLLAGRVAAQAMVEGGRGILRTLPAPASDAVEGFLATARRFGVEVAPEDTYQAVLDRLDPEQPAHLAVLYASPMLFRGAGYTLIEEGQAPEERTQAAVGAPYAHTTAPLRRLVDRYVLAIAEAFLNDREPPAWALDGLEGLPEIMGESDRRTRAAENAAVEATEAIAVAGRIGEEFEGVLVEVRSGDKPRAEVQITEPALLIDLNAEVAGSPGDPIRVRLDNVQGTTMAWSQIR